MGPITQNPGFLCIKSHISGLRLFMITVDYVNESYDYRDSKCLTWCAFTKRVPVKLTLQTVKPEIETKSYESFPLRVVKLVILKSEPAMKERGGWDLFLPVIPVCLQHIYLQNIPRNWAVKRSYLNIRIGKGQRIFCSVFNRIFQGDWGVKGGKHTQTKVLIFTQNKTLSTFELTFIVPTYYFKRGSRAKGSKGFWKTSCHEKAPPSWNWGQIWWCNPSRGRGAAVPLVS